MRILVTGGAGCIGLELVKLLNKLGHYLTILDLPDRLEYVLEDIPKNVKIISGNILDTEILYGATYKCNAVIHLAAELGVANTEKNPIRCFDVNVIGTKNILSVCVENTVDRFIFASSSEVYGEPLNNPVSETSPTSGKNIYATSKLIGEELCKSYSKEHGIEYTILRYFNTYGTYQLPKFAIPIFIRQAKIGMPIRINGSGKQIRSYMYAQDAALATTLALFNENAINDTFNIGNEANIINLNELATKIISIVSPINGVSILYDSFTELSDRIESREIYNRWCDGKKAEIILGFRPSIDLDYGVRRIADESKFLV